MKKEDIEIDDVWRDEDGDYCDPEDEMLVVGFSKEEVCVKIEEHFMGVPFEDFDCFRLDSRLGIEVNMEDDWENLVSSEQDKESKGKGA